MLLNRDHTQLISCKNHYGKIESTYPMHINSFNTVYSNLRRSVQCIKSFNFCKNCSQIFFWLCE